MGTETDYRVRRVLYCNESAVSDWPHRMICREDPSDVSAKEVSSSNVSTLRRHSPTFWVPLIIKIIGDLNLQTRKVNESCLANDRFDSRDGVNVRPFARQGADSIGV